MFYTNVLQLLTNSHFLSIPIKIIWKIGVDTKLYLNLKWRLSLYQDVLSTPKTLPQKLTLTVLQMQQVPDLEKTDSKEEIP